MDHHPRAVEIRNLKMSSFLKAQTAGVDCRQTGAVGGKPEEMENSANLIRAEDNWKLLLAMGTDKVENGKISVEGMFEEKLDAAQSNRDGRARVFLDIFEIEKILSQLFLRDQVWGFVIVLRQLTHGLDVALLSTFREAPELETLDHSLTQLCHSYTSDC
jgi:hypothetical protein